MLTQCFVRLRGLLRREAVEAEFDEELRFHLEQETERYLARGLSLGEARQAARRDFGNPARVKDEARETWRWRWLDELRLDLRYARRGLARNMGFTIVTGLSLGFGIGATTTLFSVIDALDLRPLPFRDADRLVWLAEVRSAADRFCPGCPETTVSTAEQWREQARSFEAFAFWRSTEDVYFREGDAVDYVTAGHASVGLFELLGVRPFLGRTIAPRDTASGAEAVAVLSYDAWRSRFGSDSAVVGSRFEYHGDRALTESRAATIVGVLPEGFRFQREAFLWFPLSAREQANQYADAMARLKPGVTRAGAESELRTIAARLAAVDAGRNEGRDVSVRPLLERFGWGAGRGRLILFGITAMVLLLAVMNVSGLSLARTMSRQAELAVRSSVGASPMRLVRQLLVEGICLGSIGGAIGVLFTVWGAGAASQWFRMERSGLSPNIDQRILAFTAGVAVLVGLLTALLSAVWAARSSTLNVLGDRSGSVLRPRLRRMTAVLLVAQIASGLVLLTGAGMLSSEFVKVRYLDIGFDPEDLHQVSLFGGSNLRLAPEAWRPTLEEVRRRVTEVPGVESATLRHASALDPAVIRPEGFPGTSAQEPGSPRLQAVNANYFETLRTPILAGRGFTTADRRGERLVAVVNEAAAAVFWPGESALGRQLFVGDSIGGEWLTIVGVAGDVERGEMVERHWPTVYRPLDQAPIYHRAVALYVRLAGPAASSLPALQSAVREALGHPASAFRPVSHEMDEKFVAQRFNAIALNVFAAFALLLAAIGIYGSVAYAVARRTKEIGVRVALGAERGSVLRLVAGRTTWIAAVGLATGLLGSLWISRLLRGFVSGGSAANPWTFAASALLVALVALVATYLPARRATDIDPLIALRSD